MTKSINRIERASVNGFRMKHNLSTDNALDDYARIAGQSAIYPGQGTALGLAYCALKLNGEAGELAEHVGKAMRDDNFMPLDSKGGTVARCDQKLTEDRRALIIKEVGDVLWYLAAICRELDISLSYAALENLEKLCDRTERDALRGSGDER